MPDPQTAARPAPAILGSNQRAGAPPRDRMVRSAAALFARDGLRGAGMRDVADHAGVSRGSIQHYFPGGKDQLTTEALDWMGSLVRQRLDAAAAPLPPADDSAGAPGPTDGGAVRVLDAFVDLWRRGLTETAMATGCSIAATVHDSDDPALLDRAADVFAQWCTPFRRALLSDGRPDEEADAIATTVVAALEGAVILCRARRDITPLEQTAAVLRSVVAGRAPR